jgi:hypothetical protein
MNFSGEHHSRWFTRLLGVGIALGLARTGRSQELGWFQLMRPPEASVGMEVQGTHQTTRNNGVTSTYNQLSLTPLVGLQTQGYVYHPNLVTFDLGGDIGWGWNRSTTTGPGYTQTTKDSQQLMRYLAQLNFLSAKPYNASFFATQDHTYSDYGSFNTFTVDSLRYGGVVNYNSDRVTMTADAGYRNEQDTGLNDFTEVSETYFNFFGADHRQSGQTSLTYHINQFENTVNNSYNTTNKVGSTSSSLNQSVGISDSETFGAHKQIVATTGASFSESEYSGQQLQTVTANENVNVTHTPNLDSFYSVDYSHNQLHPVTDSTVQGVSGIRHHLYESLTSQVDVHGNYQDYSGGGSSSTYDRYGFGVSENYTKKLGTWGRLTIGAGAIADHQDQNSYGDVLTTIDEPHQLNLVGPPTFLDHPNVILSSVVVKGPGGIPTQLNVDYQLVQVGDLTQILLVPTSTILHSGDVVKVTYESDSLYTASFDSLNATAQIRLDLFNKFGLYGRLNWLDNNAPPQVQTQTLTDWVGGVDYGWHWFRAGAEYEDYNSNFTAYQAWRLFQMFNCQPSDTSTFSVTLNQSSYTYPDSGSQNQYQFLSRYSIQFLSSLSWFVEGGYNIQDVLGTKQYLSSGRTGVTWTRGKLSVRAGYEYNGQSTTTPGQPNQEFDTSRLYVYLKRTF